MLALDQGDVALCVVAREVVTQYGPDGVLSFLATVDRYMESPGFTGKAAEMFRTKAGHAQDTKDAALPVIDKVGVTLNVGVNLRDMAAALSECDDKDVVDFLAYLDELMASWDFTRAAADVFTKALNDLNDHDGDPRGKTLTELKDGDGKAFDKERVEMGKAKPTFWQDYTVTTPETKKSEPKTMYCERLDETVVCGGIYK